MLRPDAAAGGVLQHARLKTELYNVDYRIPLRRIAPSLPGILTLTASVTHNRLEEEDVFAGNTQRLDGTLSLPTWSGNFQTRYQVGPVLVTYVLNDLSSSVTYRDWRAPS